MNKDKLKEYLFDLFDEYEDSDDIIQTLRLDENISNDDYDYLLNHWEEFLNEWERSE